jgi:large repetitive protein
MRLIRGGTLLRGFVIAVVAASVLLGGHAAPAANGVFSLDRLRLGSGSGPENYVFTAGDVVFPEGGADTGAYYKVVVTDAGGTTRNPAFACTPAASFDSHDNSYTIQATDPVSTGTAWRLTLQQFTNATCAGTPTKTAFKSLYVAKASTFADVNLTTPRALFSAGATAYVTIEGVKPSINDWSTTWILPSGGVACANTANNDRPDASNTGALPKPSNSFVQYRPWTTPNGSLWNRESNYETAPCPAFAGNEGLWKLKVQLDPTNFVVLPVFTADTTPPPAPTFLSGPNGPTASTSATFTFSDSESDAVFMCRLDSGTFVACSSPQTYTGLGEGNHSLELKAVDVAGNESAITARTWTVDLTAPPPPTITSGPSGTSTSSNATFEFSHADPGATFRCRLDGGGFSSCTSPQSYTGLAEGSHTFDVVAVDATGNESTAASRSWVVDTSAPVVTITDGPSGTTNSSSATFSFTADEAGASFECRLDAGAYAACTSPATYSGLADGGHTFSVRAIDLGGSTGTPATRTWTIDATAPNVTLTTPGNGTATSDLTPVFAGHAGTAVGDGSVVTVHVYVGPTPTGTPLQTLTAGRQPDGSYSVEATSVLPEGTYTAQAEQTDAVGNVGRSTANAFAVDAAAPTVTITDGPPDPTNATTATLTFSADEAGATFLCKLDGGSFDGCSSPKSYTGLSQGGHTFAVKAVDQAGNESAVATRTWTVDTTAPPTPTIVSGPSGTVSEVDATFTFSDTEAGVAFFCQLDGGGFSPCTSPAAYTGLGAGSHTFQVRARDTAGNDSAAAARTWTIDTGGPTVTITGSPSNPTNQTTAAFTFTASEAGSTFECRLDGGAYSSCTSPRSYTGLDERAHTFEVKATDPAGNAGPAASFTWTVDLTAPVVTITGGPSNPSTSSGATFTFGAGEGGVGFLCQLDGGGFASCSSPKAYTGLTDGSHTFEVKGVDAAGNTGAPASRTWTIDATVPAVTLTAPANGSSTGDQTPTFSGSAGTASGDSTAVTVKVYAGATPSGTAVQTLSTTQSGGAYSIDAAPALAFGTYTAQSEQADAAGNIGLSTANTFTINAADTTPPAITLTTPAHGSSTSSSLPTFAGTGGIAPGDLATVTVKLYSGPSATGAPIQTLSTTRDAGTGAYSVLASSGLGGGTYTARADQSDSAGNLGLSTANTFTVSSPYRTAVMGDNPGGYWRLGEASGTTAVDETGTNPGTYQNGVVLGQPGALSTDGSTAASFDGVNDIVTVPSNASLNATTGVTAEAWVKRTSSGVWQNIVAKPGNGATASQNYALWINTTNRPVAYFGNGSSSIGVTSTTVLDTNWHHVAATYDNATAKIYVDGVLTASASSSVQLTASTGSLVIGRTPDNVRIFGGLLDEVAVYRAALTAARIQAHYNAGTSVDTTPPAVTLTTPANGATIGDPMPTFSGAAGTAAGDLTTVTVKVYNGPSASGTPVQTMTTTQSGGSWSVAVGSPLSEGTYTARAEQADVAGNVGLSTANTFTFTSADITPPAVTLTTPAEGSSTSNPTPTLSGAAGTAPGDLPTVTVKIWAGITPSGPPLQTHTTTASGGTWSVTSAPLAEGTYAARAEQLDSAGNDGLSNPRSFTIGTTYRDEVLADNARGYWRLGETGGTVAADETGTNPGTYLNGVALGQPDALTADTNTAASFDGVDDMVSVPSNASLNATSGVTVEAWVKRTRSGAWQNIVAKPGSGAAAAQNYALWINTLNQPVVYIGNGSSTVSVTAPTAIDTNWHHLAATYDEATARLYVDGVLRGSVNSTLQLTANSQPLTIGRSTDSLRIFGGLIDEPAVYTTALSASRIQVHYQKGNAIDTVAPVVTLTTPVADSSTRNTVTHFAGGASTTGTDSPTVTVKIYTGTTATGTPVQTLSTSWFTSGAWSVDASSALPLGTYTARAEQTDLAGNVGMSAANTFTILAPSSSPDPLLAGAGDIADCTDTGVQDTANQILGLPPSTTVITLGDNAYPHGSASDFSNCYDPTWGQFKSRTRPAIGDHEYETPNASGYFNYFQNQLAPFGASATDPNRAYYSYDIANWHVAVLNAACADAPACSPSGQAAWLDADLEAHPNQCTFAVLSAPRWSSGSVHGSNPTMGQYFQVLYDHRVDLVLGGDDHVYERFAPQDPQGFYDPANGVRQITAGTGGGSLYTFGSVRANSEVRRSGNYGILKLTLHSSSYEWEFVPTSGTFSDSGTTPCH